MNTHRFWIAALPFLVFAPSADASWLSKATGINIDLMKPLGSAVVRPQTRELEAAIAVPAPPPVPSITVVTDVERMKLIESIDLVRTSAAQNSERNSRFALGMVVAAILLGVASSIAGFCKAALPAGVLSLLATTAVGANNTLPFKEDAHAYRLVSAEAHALSVRANLNLHMTPGQYDAILSDLILLAKRGDSGALVDSPQQLDDLINTLHLPTSVPDGGA